jgi:acetylornithine deacetylase/succinyl-diaminopimelate desuccinylase-like protein
LLGPATVTIVGIKSAPDNGTAVVPDRCRIRVDRRYLRTETPAKVQAEIQAIVDRLAKENPDFKCDVNLFNHYPLMFVDPENPIVKAGVAAYETVNGAPPKVTAWQFGVNATFMAELGIPTVGIGPGNEKYAHTPEEHVPVADLTQCCKLWTRLIVDVCGEAA